MYGKVIYDQHERSILAKQYQREHSVSVYKPNFEMRLFDPVQLADKRMQSVPYIDTL